MGVASSEWNAAAASLGAPGPGGLAVAVGLYRQGSQNNELTGKNAAWGSLGSQSELVFESGWE